jgi:hypothetical protein
MLLALAIYNGVLVAPRFPLFLFKKLLKWPVTFEDYSEIDGALVNSLSILAEEKSAIADIYFVVPGNPEFELIRDGENVPVTPKNISKYLNKLSDYFLHESVSWQFLAFKTGFENICGDSVIYGYRPDELFALAYGSDQFDISELSSICNYEGGYSEKSPQVQWLWQLLENDFDVDSLRHFLFFSTGSSRAPLEGLRNLKIFTVACLPGDSERLPTSHTCFNTLLLPEYGSKEKLNIKLRLALQHHQGFGLI